MIAENLAEYGADTRVADMLRAQPYLLDAGRVIGTAGVEEKVTTSR